MFQLWRQTLKLEMLGVHKLSKYDALEQYTDTQIVTKYE
jgi:hypothetical protein